MRYRHEIHHADDVKRERRIYLAWMEENGFVTQNDDVKYYVNLLLYLTAYTMVTSSSVELVCTANASKHGPMTDIDAPCITFGNY